MPKLVIPASIQKPEFTDYTLAGTPQGEVDAMVCRAFYEWKRDDIYKARSLRRAARRFEPVAHNQAQSRGGFPTKRERNPELSSKRRESKALDRFKLVDRITHVLGEFVYSTKVFQLHATRGWKVCA